MPRENQGDRYLDLLAADRNPDLLAEDRNLDLLAADRKSAETIRISKKP